MEYPYRDIFDFWSAPIDDLTHPQLKEGILFNDMLLRRGGLGYKLSIWDGDARLFITDRVNAELAGTPSEGHGMGVMLQLGPKWLRKFGDIVAPNALIQNVLGQFIIFGIEHPEHYLARLNRLDVAVDVIGLDIGEFSIDEWRSQWVGYANQKTFHDSARTGRLEGLSIGTSQGMVRFKVYDKVNESLARGTSGFWHSVWNINPDDKLPVARFEWTLKCYEAKFTHTRYLQQLGYLEFLELLNYASLKWGRLCTPKPNDDNKARWELAPLWVELRKLIYDWQFGYEKVAKRVYELKPDMNDSYLRSIAGWIAGFQARVGIEQDENGSSSLQQALDYLIQAGYSLEDIQAKADKKWRLYSHQAGLRDNS